MDVLGCSIAQEKSLRLGERCLRLLIDELSKSTGDRERLLEGEGDRGLSTGDLASSLEKLDRERITEGERSFLWGCLLRSAGNRRTGEGDRRSLRFKRSCSEVEFDRPSESACDSS